MDYHVSDVVFSDRLLLFMILYNCLFVTMSFCYLINIGPNTCILTTVLMYYTIFIVAVPSQL